MKLLLVLPAAALLVACGTPPSTFSDGYATQNFFTNPANSARGPIVRPGEYEAANPSKAGCKWDVQDVKTGDRESGYNEPRSTIVLGQDVWLQSTGCGEWKPTRTESSNVHFWGVDFARRP